MPSPLADAPAAFIARWSAAQAAERANYALFLSELCDLLGVPRPDPATDDSAHNAYVFERAVTFHHRGSAKTTTGRIDLYKRACFVLEAKQYASAKTSDVGRELAHAPTTRAGSPPTRAVPLLTPKEKLLHDAALVSTLKQLHDDLDAAVAAAYGWPWPLADAEILERVVALNTARAAEESTGLIRWLRPDYQNSEARNRKSGGKQSTLALPDVGAVSHRDSASPAAAAHRKSPIQNRKPAKPTWPKTMAERAKAVESYLSAAASPVTPADVAKSFQRANPKEVAEILETLAALSRARPGDTPGTYVP